MRLVGAFKVSSIDIKNKIKYKQRFNLSVDVAVIEGELENGMKVKCEID